MDRDVVSQAFDAAFYLAAYPDIAAAGVDPLEHFLVTGWREQRNPNAWFSVRDYAEANPDIAEAGINPFSHYLRTGRSEGRARRFNLGFRYDLIRAQQPATVRLQQSLDALGAVRADPFAQLVQGLRGATHGLARIHLTLGHDDYAATFGGAQLCVRLESAGCAARGIDHLHLHPAEPCLFVRQAGEPGPLRVMLNGEALGLFTAETVARALAKTRVAAASGSASIAIHSLLGHAADEVVQIAESLGAPAAFFWLHDFASLCDGFQLLRNDVEDCGAPPADSPACAICIYGPLRRRQVDAHRRLFERLPLTVVSPSESALAFWRSAGAFPAATVVHPHAGLRPRVDARKPRAHRKLRIAYLGMPIAYKGWAAFDELARRLANDGRYEFLHLGAYPAPASVARFHKVNAADGAADAMSVAIEDLAVDVALIWPLVRETFSFTAYEAVAAGAAVVTHPGSGNVAAFVRECGAGLVFDDEQALEAAFATGEVMSLGRKRRGAQLYDLRYSGMSLDLLERDPQKWNPVLR
jgi:hypothetical protein